MWFVVDDASDTALRDQQDCVCLVCATVLHTVPADTKVYTQNPIQYPLQTLHRGRMSAQLSIQLRSRRTRERRNELGASAAFVVPGCRSSLVRCSRCRPAVFSLTAPPPRHHHGSSIRSLTWAIRRRTKVLSSTSSSRRSQRLLWSLTSALCDLRAPAARDCAWRTRRRSDQRST